MDKTKRTIWKAVAVSLCIWAVLLSIDLFGEKKLPQDSFQLGATVKSWRSSWPKLVKYGQFLENLETKGQLGLQMAQMSPLGHLHRLLLFNDDLIEVGQHNLLALAGFETYYIQQIWPHSSGLKPLFANETEATHVAGEPVQAPFLSMFLPQPEKRFEPENLNYVADHRSCLGPARDQLKCGSCYAFSVISLIEWHYCKQFNEELADFSEQYAIDCGRPTNVVGCTEGRLAFVKNFFVLYGLKREVDWPYTGIDPQRDECSPEETEFNRIQVNVRPWIRITISQEILEQTLRYQPILLHFALPANFKRYKSGLYPLRNCDKQRRHGLLLVGHGSEDGKEFWLIRNSHGEHWGELGYIRVLKSASTMDDCFREAFVSKFKFDYDQERSDAFYDSFNYFPPEYKVVPRQGMSRALLHY